MRIATSLVALSFLAACAADPPPPAGPPVPVTGVMCPPSGTVAVRSDGTRVTYQGADPTDPATCIQTGSGGARAGLLAAILSPTGSSWPPAAVAANRRIMAEVFPLAVGRRSGAASYDTPSINLTTGQPTGGMTRLEASFRVVREETVQVGSEARPAWVLERPTRSANGTDMVTYWIDKATGVPLRMSRVRPDGSTVGNNWYVTELAIGR